MVDRQLSFDDYTYTVEQVIIAERRPMSGQDQAYLARQYYERNAELLSCHRRAASVIAEAGLPVSAKFLTNFARYMTKYREVAHRLVEIYAGARINGAEDYKIPDFTTPWLTRYLEEAGYPVRKARSKMDGEAI